MLPALIGVIVLVGMLTAVACAVLVSLVFFVIRLALFPLRLLIGLLFLPLVLLAIVVMLIVGVVLVAVPLVPVLFLALFIWLIVRIAARPTAVRV